MSNLSNYLLELSQQLGDSIEDLNTLRTRPMRTIKKDLK